MGTRYVAISNHYQLDHAVSSLVSMFWLLSIVRLALGLTENECAEAVKSVHAQYGGIDKQARSCRDRVRLGHRGYVRFVSELPQDPALRKCKVIIDRLIFRYAMFANSTKVFGLSQGFV
jgi:hypothetical protein